MILYVWQYSWQTTDVLQSSVKLSYSILLTDSLIYNGLNPIPSFNHISFIPMLASPDSIILSHLDNYLLTIKGHFTISHDGSIVFSSHDLITVPLYHAFSPLCAILFQRNLEHAFAFCIFLPPWVGTGSFKSSSWITDTYTGTELSSGWLPWSPLGTLKLAFNVSSEDQGSHSDDLPVSEYLSYVVSTRS